MAPRPNREAQSESCISWVIARPQAARSEGSSISRPDEPWEIWSCYSSDSAADSRSPLQHRFCHGQAEPFGQALLHDDVGPPLQGVDHGPVFLNILHRQACQVNP